MNADIGLKSNMGRGESSAEPYRKRSTFPGALFLLVAKAKKGDSF